MTPVLRGTPSRTVPSRALRFAQIAALLSCVLFAARPGIGQGVSLGHVAMVLLAPMWLPALRRHVGGVVLVGAAALAGVSAVWLTVLASADHATVTNNLVENTVLIAGSAAAVGLLLWARTLLPVWLIGSAYGVGLIISVVTHQSVIGYNEGSGGEVNVWKFAFAVPVAVILLASTNAARRSVDVVALLLLGLASAAFDSRSLFGEFVVAALLVVWQLLPTVGDRASALRVLVGFGIVLGIVYQLGTSLILGGVLGDETQARSAAQVQRAGSILVGSRPEMGATAALFLSRPFGFGAGTLATSSDIQTAKAGMQAIDYDPENGYVENFLFGSKIEVHSTAGDLWAIAGIPGILFAGVCTVLLLRVVTRGIAVRQVSGLVLFLSLQSIWNLFFNPLQSSAPVLVLALGLGLALQQRSGRPARRPSDPPSRPAPVLGQRRAVRSG